MKATYTQIENCPIVFHFNKKHLEDAEIPMWTVKAKGQTFYVNHLESKIGFSTKETPENNSTKGSLKFKGNLTLKHLETGETEAIIE